MDKMKKLRTDLNMFRKGKKYAENRLRELEQWERIDTK